jgi:hypothetical protein
MFGATIVDMKEIGKIIRCTDKVKLNGLMAENMRANMSMIKNTESVHFTGQMEENIKALGKMESNTVVDNIILFLAKSVLDNG